MFKLTLFWLQKTVLGQKEACLRKVITYAYRDTHAVPTLKRKKCALFSRYTDKAAPVDMISNQSKWRIKTRKLYNTNKGKKVINWRNIHLCHGMKFAIGLMYINICMKYIYCIKRLDLGNLLAFQYETIMLQYILLHHRYIILSTYLWSLFTVGLSTLKQKRDRNTVGLENKVLTAIKYKWILVYDNVQTMFVENMKKKHSQNKLNTINDIP